jgi:hypothetical protein
MVAIAFFRVTQCDALNEMMRQSEPYRHALSKEHQPLVIPAGGDKRLLNVDDFAANEDHLHVLILVDFLRAQIDNCSRLPQNRRDLVDRLAKGDLCYTLGGRG